MKESSTFNGNKDLFNIPVKLVTCLLHSRKPEAIIKGSFQKDPVVIGSCQILNEKQLGCSIDDFFSSWEKEEKDKGPMDTKKGSQYFNRYKGGFDFASGGMIV